LILQFLIISVTSHSILSCIIFFLPNWNDADEQCRNWICETMCHIAIIQVPLLQSADGRLAAH
jgi:hypothetical protein